jgi:multiple sugar transport system permease protein
MTWAMPSVVMTSVWKWTPFAFFIILAQVQTIDTDLYERARIQGATTWQAFRDITLPNLKSAILIIILVRGIWMFNKFDVIWLTTKGGPIETTNTLPIQVYKLAFTSLEFGQATALAGIMFTLLVAAGLLYFYLFSPSEEVAN